MEITIQHDKRGQEFTISLNGDTAELSYARPSTDVIEFQHTYVPESFQGRGIGSKLIAHGLQFAREQNLKVVASCQAVESYLNKNPNEKDLLL